MSGDFTLERPIPSIVLQDAVEEIGGIIDLEQSPGIGAVS